jgi:hypothetical protein
MIDRDEPRSGCGPGKPEQAHPQRLFIRIHKETPLVRRRGFSVV